ncbi:MAG: insulinase family protein [Flavobacteriales bacterium]
MHTRSLATAMLVATAIAPASAQKKYDYVSVPNDPIGARIYTLPNGLKVYLSQNKDKPRVQTNIATRAGSKNDPATATGLAHYLEHMLFKGTHEIATLDWEKESALLERISDTYEERRTVTDEAKRDALYHRIDSLSTEAAKYAVPNEYDKMVSSLGASGTNAFTSTERTVYVNDIPSNALEKWMMIESTRFQQLVLRLFHTELETVFEEFNRGQDNDQRKASVAMAEHLYKKHPYGTQTTIGTGEHLKNPSMVKIHEFFDTYYVPNNMAVVLAGDLDYDGTIAMVDKYFGGWKTKPVPAFSFQPEDPIAAPESVDVLGPMAEWVSLGWRFDGVKGNDAIMLDLIAGLLSNGQAGLMDLNLVQKQRVINAVAFAFESTDYSQFGMNANAKQGQTLEEARDLLLEQLDLLKNGAFDDWLIDAVVNDKRQSRTRQWSDNNGARASTLTNTFILQRDWKDVVDYLDRMGRITKADVTAFAKSHFTNNHVCVFKRTGEDKSTFKVTKPVITPIGINREGQSAWFAEWAEKPMTDLQPEFVDYDKSITRRSLQHNVPLAYIPNTSNDLFTLVMVQDLGNYSDPKLKLAIEYLPYLGTSKYTAAQLQQEFFKLGMEFTVQSGQDRNMVSLSGLDKNMPQGIALLEHLLADAQPNKEALAELVKDIIKVRGNNKKNKGIIMNSALLSYARYGDLSPFKDILSTAQLNAVTPDELIQRIKSLTTYAHRMFYYGARPVDEVVAVLDKEHLTPEELKSYPKHAPYVELPTQENKVYFVDYDMVQTELMLVSKSDMFNTGKLPYGTLFNEYFGSGLSSIVFQEIREAKALAYSANAQFTRPAKKEEAHYVRAYIGTQNDKLGDAVTAMLALMNSMPADEKMFNGSKDAALKQIASQRATKEAIYWSWENAQRLGIDHDLNRDVYSAIQGSSLDGLSAFFNKNIANRTYTYLAIGKESAMDMKALERLGPVTKLSLEQVFGY